VPGPFYLICNARSITCIKSPSTWTALRWPVTTLPRPNHSGAFHADCAELVTNPGGVDPVISGFPPEPKTKPLVVEASSLGGLVDFAKISAPYRSDEMKDDDPKLAYSEWTTLTVKEVTWAMAGRVAHPGRYLFNFGWLTITADDLAIWRAYPNAAFTLIRTLTAPPAETEEATAGEEFRLGTFDLRIASTYSTSEK
jgi:hypothetical protein